MDISNGRRTLSFGIVLDHAEFTYNASAVKIADGGDSEALRALKDGCGWFETGGAGYVAKEWLNARWRVH